MTRPLVHVVFGPLLAGLQRGRGHQAAGGPDRGEDGGDEGQEETQPEVGHADTASSSVTLIRNSSHIPSLSSHVIQSSQSVVRSMAVFCVTAVLVTKQLRNSKCPQIRNVALSTQPVTALPHWRSGSDCWGGVEGGGGGGGGADGGRT